ncbi:MAG: ASCH domain-containing protein [Planctomycetes bacterium]|nr:ASCH domain-containing protein [Planctomycetota bacterium]
MNHHLVILKKGYLDLILAGRKTVELRLTKVRCAPFGRISAGDRLFFKISSGAVCGVGKVRKIKELSGLTKAKVEKLKSKYNHLICGDDKYWGQKKDCLFGVLVWLEGVKAMKPVRIEKKDWRAWVVLQKNASYGLLEKGK